MSDLHGPGQEGGKVCCICGTALVNPPITVPEMSMGTGERFQCSECPACGSVQLLDVPNDLSRYYPAAYYSFAVRRKGPFVRWLKRHRASGVLGSPTMLSGLVRLAAGDPPFAAWARSPYLTRMSRILDVGAGGGGLLREMAIAGFQHVRGVDPYLDADVEVYPGVHVLKGRLEEITELFDAVMLHHVLEHFADPVHAIREVARVTRPGGYAIVRVPLSGTHAWKTYGASWVQLDPPRHICIPSLRGMELIAGKGGFDVAEVSFDSTAFQFWGSEQVRRGIPLHDPRSVHMAGGSGSFTRREMRVFEARARDLNRARDGDQACFYLRRNG